MIIIIYHCYVHFGFVLSVFISIQIMKVLCIDLSLLFTRIHGHRSVLTVQHTFQWDVQEVRLITFHETAPLGNVVKILTKHSSSCKFKAMAQ